MDICTYVKIFPVLAFEPFAVFQEPCYLVALYKMLSSEIDDANNKVGSTIWIWIWAL